MGQYFKPVSLDTMEFLRSWSYECGAKLMEHSWITNNFVEAVEMLLIENGRWDKHRIVWTGDYADPEDISSEFWKQNIKYFSGKGVQLNDRNISNLLDDSRELKFLIEAIPADHYYLVNFDKMLYVDKRKVSYHDTWNDGTPMQIHPLPLLTAEGNGNGGGDFNGEDPKKLIGSWARNRIGLRNAIPEGFTELIFDLVE